MVYNSYFANVITRLGFLMATFIALAWLLVNTSRFFTIFFLSLIAIAQIISLIKFLNKTNRDLARFLLLLTEEDTSVIAWKDRVEKTFRGLHHSFKQVNEEIGRIRMEKEKGIILLQRVIDHMNTGVFVADETGLVRLVNEEALKMIGLKDFATLEDLDHAQKGLASEFSRLRHQSGNILQIQSAGQDKIPVMVKVSAFRLDKKDLRIFSIQNLKNELEANEIESWQKLTRVLAHEISNSVTPIATLGTGIHRKLVQATMEEDGGLQISAKAASDLLQSSELITQRGNALIEFVDHYKRFTRLPDPVMTQVDIRVIFKNIAAYFKEELMQSAITLQTEVSEELPEMEFDQNLMEQALINLVRNAIFVLSGQSSGIIRLRASRRGKHEMVLEVSDNGPGIPPEIQSQVFVPFFTTKQKGTGIGLSIVRKILNMHGGSIRFQTGEGEGTTFILRLPMQDRIE
jgi:nitrogen fixation/metabolism regulation signal transduction histidine kinase